MKGVVYLLHFDRPLHHARHYIGFCQTRAGLETRFSYHRSGRGSKLLKAVGGGWQLARLWKGTRDDERALKNRKEAPELCPICRQNPRPVKAMEGIPL